MPIHQDMKEPAYEVSFAGARGRRIEVTAGAASVWKFRFACGSRPVKAGGGLKIFCEVPKFWLGLIPQKDDPDRKWFCRAAGSVPAEIVELAGSYKSLCLAGIRLPEGLSEGQSVEFSFGTPERPAYAIAHAYNRVLVSMMVDYEADGGFTRIWPPLRIDVIPGPAVKAAVVLPSVVRPGQPLVIRARFEDVNSNPVEAAGRPVRLLLEGPGGKQEWRRETGPGGVVAVEGVKVDKPGVYFARAAAAGDEKVAGSSNPMLCADSGEGVFWGDCHCHTGWSDGIGTVEDNLLFARDRAFLDVFGFAEHLAVKDFTTQPVDKGGSDWAYLGPTMAEASNRWNAAGKFVTMLGYEYTPGKTVRDPSGDCCVFSRGGSWSDLPAATELNDLLALSKAAGCLVIPHVGGRTPKWDKVAFAPETTPLVEIASMHGKFEAFAQAGLQQGYKLGFCGMSDGHYGKPGYDCWALHGRIRSLKERNFSVQSAITAFLCRELTREAVFESLRRRRTYATTGERIFLRFEVNGASMGESLVTRERPEIHIRVAGSAPISRIDLIRGGRGVAMWECKGEEEAEIRWVDKAPSPAETYYYARIIQADFANAWSSPVWVAYTGPDPAGPEQESQLPEWNAAPEWPASTGLEVPRDLLALQLEVFERKGIADRFPDLEPVGIFSENRGRFVFYRGYDRETGSRIHCQHYFEFDDDRLLISPGWSPYGQVLY